MKKNIIGIVALMLSSNAVMSQSDTLNSFDDSAFTFTEAQLGEDDDQAQNITVLGSNNNIFAMKSGMTFSASRYRFRALNSKFNTVYANGVLLNELDGGQFRFSSVGGLNNITNNAETALPSEAAGFAMTSAAGSVNYNFRASAIPVGNKATVSLANRNYTARAMYTFGTGILDNGWAFGGTVGVRYAKEGYVEGTFYNSLSYLVSAENRINNHHTISLTSWGNPTRKGGQGASTDEAYWLAGSNHYNPYWGYQEGKKRNSRVVDDYQPTTMATWDYNVNDRLKLSTSLLVGFSKYSSTKLNYNGGQNPSPDYWKNMPSSMYNVWSPESEDEFSLADWNVTYNYWTQSKENRQINWDELYLSNIAANQNGTDAMYYVQARHQDKTNVALASNFRYLLTLNSYINGGISAMRSKTEYYQTLDDLLGAKYFHNINSYANGYSIESDAVRYDLREPLTNLSEGDKFGYDYNLFVDRCYAWAGYTLNVRTIHFFVDSKIDYVDYQREGLMRNGMAPYSSYGRSSKANFVGGGGKVGTSINLHYGNSLMAMAGAELVAPTANTIFCAPEINNDFVQDAALGKLYTVEIGYSYKNPFVKLNINGYFARLNNETEWTCFYYDDGNSFTYVSMTGVDKEYRGVEIGAEAKICSWLDATALVMVSDAKYLNDCTAKYMMSSSAQYSEDYCFTKGMRESGTPLSAYSLSLYGHYKGWNVELTGNYFERIYLGFSAMQRYKTTLNNMAALDNTGAYVDNAGNYNVPKQAKSNGGFMLNLSVGRNIRLPKGSLYVGVMADNVLNNRDICIGGYEQNRGEQNRDYKFSKNSKKYYAFGINGMLNLVYRF